MGLAGEHGMASPDTLVSAGRTSPVRPIVSARSSKYFAPGREAKPGVNKGCSSIRDQAKADTERAHAMLQHSGNQAVTPQMLSKFARTARQRIRLEGGGYSRDHLRALAQRVEVAEGEVRIMGSKSRLLQTLMANGGANAVPTQGLKWRRGWDSNPRRTRALAGFQDRCLKPLGHPSARLALKGKRWG